MPTGVYPRNQDKLLGKRFSKLIVKKFVGRLNGAMKWLCVCDCGGTRTVYSADLTSGYAKTCGCTLWLKRKDPRQGWVKKEQTKIVEWRKSVLLRDNNICQGAGPHKGRLEAHHIKSFENYPELRFDMNNGLSLCKACHVIYERKTREIEKEEKIKRAFNNGFYAALEVLNLTDKHEELITHRDTEFSIFKTSQEELKTRGSYKILVDNNGGTTFVYTDVFSKLLSEGKAEVTRVSNVEPNEKGEWIAEMKDGVLLGPYKLRSHALTAEVKYLENKLFLLSEAAEVIS